MGFDRMRFERLQLRYATQYFCGELRRPGDMSIMEFTSGVGSTSRFDDVAEAIEILNQLKSFGVKVALDDFGTGYSSLSSLSSLPLDKLKVDQSFVRRIERDPASRAITRAMIVLGRALNLEIVAEGIESEGTLGYLRNEGCDQAQGFWVSHPLPAQEFAHWYRKRHVH